MENNKILKTYENFTDQNNVSDDDFYKRLQELINNILTKKDYIFMLRDTVHVVLNMLEQQLPPDANNFLEMLDEMNNVQLYDSFDSIYEILDIGGIIDDVEILCSSLEKLENISNSNFFKNNKKKSNNKPYEEEEEVQEKKEIFIKEQKNYRQNLSKKHIDIKEFIKKHKKNVESTDKPLEKFKKGDIVYLYGIKGPLAKKFNDKEFEIISKSEDYDDCYDLYDPTIKTEKGVANVKNVPSSYIYLKKKK